MNKVDKQIQDIAKNVPDWFPAVSEDKRTAAWVLWRRWFEENGDPRIPGGNVCFFCGRDVYEEGHDLGCIHLVAVALVVQSGIEQGD